MSKLSHLTLWRSDVLRAHFQRGNKENGVSKTQFWTTVSPHDAFSAPMARSGSRPNVEGLAAPEDLFSRMKASAEKRPPSVEKSKRFS